MLAASAGTCVAVAEAIVGSLAEVVSTTVIALSLSVKPADAPERVRAHPSGTWTL
jgi:hypothetical protein